MKDISKMNIEELVHLVNSALKDGLSVNKFCSANGLKGSTVKTKLRKGGYTYNDSLKAYMIADTKDDIKSDTIINTKNKINNDTKIEKLEARMLKMEERLDKLESSRKLSKGFRSKKDRYYINNRRDTVTKGIRLYTEVKEQLDKYLETHKNKKVIEVFSYAILDYINKYK